MAGSSTRSVLVSAVGRRRRRRQAASADGKFETGVPDHRRGRKKARAGRLWQCDGSCRSWSRARSGKDGQSSRRCQVWCGSCPGSPSEFAALLLAARVNASQTGAVRSQLQLSQFFSTCLLPTSHAPPSPLALSPTPRDAYLSHIARHGQNPCRESCCPSSITSDSLQHECGDSRLCSKHD